MKTQASQSAAEDVVTRRAAILKKLDAIRAAVEAKPPEWSAAADLGYVFSSLCDLARFLRVKEDE